MAETIGRIVVGVFSAIYFLFYISPLWVDGYRNLFAEKRKPKIF